MPSQIVSLSDYPNKVFNQGVTVVQVTDDATVKGAPGVLFGLHVSHTGFTAGDTIVIKDGSTARWTYTAAAAGGNYNFGPCQGMNFATSIVVDVTKSGGSCTVTLVYN